MQNLALSTPSNKVINSPHFNFVPIRQGLIDEKSKKRSCSMKKLHYDFSNELNNYCQAFNSYYDFSPEVKGNKLNQQVKNSSTSKKYKDLFAIQAKKAQSGHFNLKFIKENLDSDEEDGDFSNLTSISKKNLPSLYKIKCDSSHKDSSESNLGLSLKKKNSIYSKLEENYKRKSSLATFK